MLSEHGTFVLTASQTEIQSSSVNNTIPAKAKVKRQQSTTLSTHSTSHHSITWASDVKDSVSYPVELDEIVEPELLLEPVIKPISHEELSVDMDKTYKRLVELEAECMAIQKQQPSYAESADPKSKYERTKDQWTAWTASHKVLLD